MLTGRKDHKFALSSIVVDNLLQQHFDRRPSVTDGIVTTRFYVVVATEMAQRTTRAKHSTRIDREIVLDDVDNPKVGVFEVRRDVVALEDIIRGVAQHRQVEAHHVRADDIGARLVITSQNLDGAAGTRRDIQDQMRGPHRVQPLDVKPVDATRTVADRSVRDHEELLGLDRLAIAVDTETVGDGPFVAHIETGRLGVEADEQLRGTVYRVGHDTILPAACDLRAMPVTIIDTVPTSGTGARGSAHDALFIRPINPESSSRR